MSTWQIILLAVASLSFAIGRYSGYHNGYLAGRKAVRRLRELEMSR